MSDQSDVHEIRFVNPPGLEKPPGYSHVVDVRGSRLIFLAGQAALDGHGVLAGGNELEAQAERAFTNISIALASVGCTAKLLAT